jgi:hypothetical protein
VATQLPWIISKSPSHLEWALAAPAVIPDANNAVDMAMNKLRMSYSLWFSV